MRTKTLLIALFLSALCVPALASNTRNTEADALISTSHAITWNLPAAADTLVGRASTDTLTNKSISGSTNTLTAIPAGTALSGQVPVANGGTGASTLTANNVILGNGTSAVTFVAPGTNGNVLTSNGTTWTSAAASGGGSAVNFGASVALSANITAGNPVIFTSSIYDSNSAYSNSTGKFTCPVAGVYLITAWLNNSSAIVLQIIKNSSVYMSIAGTAGSVTGGSGAVSCAINDTIWISGNTTISSGSWGGTASSMTVSLIR